MTPKEKSEELIEEFHQAMYAPIGGGAYTYTNRAKQCAITCVNEIIAASPLNPSHDGYYELTSDRLEDVLKYWQEVKQHLEAM